MFLGSPPDNPRSIFAGMESSALSFVDQPSKSHPLATRETGNITLIGGYRFERRSAPEGKVSIRRVEEYTTTCSYVENES